MVSVESFGNLRVAAGQTNLNTHLQSNSYVGGVHPSELDVNAFSKVFAAPPKKDTAPHLTRWFNHMNSFSENERKAWGGGATANKTTDEDDFNLFDDESPEEAAAAKEMQAKVTAAAAAPKAKKVVINKSQLVIDVKPSSLETDLKAVEKLVRAIEMDGVEWSQTSKLLPIAYGLMKLQIGAVIIDDLVVTDDIIERIECLGMDAEKTAAKIKRRAAGDDDEDEEEDDPSALVQSAEIVSFNKL